MNITKVGDNLVNISQTVQQRVSLDVLLKQREQLQATVNSHLAKIAELDNVINQARGLGIKTELEIKEALSVKPIIK